MYAVSSLHLWNAVINGLKEIIVALFKLQTIEACILVF